MLSDNIADDARGQLPKWATRFWLPILVILFQNKLSKLQMWKHPQQLTCCLFFPRSQGLPWRESGQNGVIHLLHLPPAAFSFHSSTWSFRGGTGSDSTCGIHSQPSISRTVCWSLSVKRRAWKRFMARLIYLLIVYFIWLVCLFLSVKHCEVDFKSWKPTHHYDVLL